MLANGATVNLTGTVTEYAPGATGNVAPVARIAGSTTKLSGPHGIVIDPQGNVRVTNANGTIDTFAAPEVWTRFADFYQRSADAAKSAYNASRARDGDEFKKYVAELRAGCDGCHALYQKKD